jgi:hypothetical protein
VVKVLIPGVSDADKAHQHILNDIRGFIRFSGKKGRRDF